MKNRGRPKNSTTTPIKIVMLNWVVIELLRDRERQDAPRRSVRDGSAAAEKMYAKIGAEVPASTLRRHHGEAKKMLQGLADDAGITFESLAEKWLAEVRARREKCGWQTHPLVLFGII